MSICRYPKLASRAENIAPRPASYTLIHPSDVGAIGFLYGTQATAVDTETETPVFPWYKYEVQYPFSYRRFYDTSFLHFMYFPALKLPLLGTCKVWF